MNKASKHIYNFLDDHLGLYDNQQGIEFCMNVDDTVFVIYGIKDSPLEAYFDFGLLYPSNTFNNFMRDFRFAGTQQLKALTPAHLWEMYYKGKAEIYCTLVVKVIFFALYFRREGNQMIVRNDNDIEYELGEILQTPRQFAEYTQQQFLLHEG
jgi:hypothetical protein